MPLLTYFFLGWVGLGLGNFVGFMIILIAFQPNRIWYIANTLFGICLFFFHRDALLCSLFCDHGLDGREISKCENIITR